MIAGEESLLRPSSTARTLLDGEITGPVTPGRSRAGGRIFVAGTGRALHWPCLACRRKPENACPSRSAKSRGGAAVAGAGSGTIFQADRAEDRRPASCRGSARKNPVIEATGHFVAAMAPTFHPLARRAAPGRFRTRCCTVLRISRRSRGRAVFATCKRPAAAQPAQVAAHRAQRCHRGRGAGTLTVN